MLKNKPGEDDSQLAIGSIECIGACRGQGLVSVTQWSFATLMLEQLNGTRGNYRVGANLKNAVKLRH